MPKGSTAHRSLDETPKKLPLSEPHRMKRGRLRRSVFVRPFGLPSRIFRTRAKPAEISTPKIRSATKLTAKAPPLHPVRRKAMATLFDVSGEVRGACLQDLLLEAALRPKNIRSQGELLQHRRWRGSEFAAGKKIPPECRLVCPAGVYLAPPLGTACDTITSHPQWSA